jgi:acyl-CoA synthetase (NDP forming)
MAVVIRWRYAPEILQMALALTEACWRREIAVYFSLSSAVQAVAKIVAWRRMREER